MTTHDVAVGDRTLHIRDAGSGPPVVMLHSLTFDSAMFDAQVPGLAEAHRVLRVDLHGHGATRIPSKKLDLEQIADDVVAALDALGVPHASFVGHSMGGMVSQRIALRHPDRVASLALLNTSGQPEAPHIRDMYHQVNEGSRGKPTNAATVGFVLSLMFSPTFAAEHPDRVEPFRALLSDPPDPEGVYWTAYAVIWRSDLREHLPRIACPTLVVTSSKDGSTPPDHGRTIARLIPDAAFVSLDGAGHLTPVERPDEVTRLLLEHLEGR